MQHWPVLARFPEEMNARGMALGHEHHVSGIKLVVHVAAETDKVFHVGGPEIIGQAGVPVVEVHGVASELHGVLVSHANGIGGGQRKTQRTQSLSFFGIIWAVSVQSSKSVTRQVPSRSMTAAEY